MSTRWERKNGEWVSRRANEVEGRPEPSTHLAFAHEGDLHVVRLKDGMIFERLDEGCRLNGAPIGAAPRPCVIETQAIGVRFVEPGVASLTIADLGVHAEALGADTIRLFVPDSPRVLPFRLSESQWVCDASEMEGLPRPELAIGGSGVDTELLNVRWSWEARGLRLFALASGETAAPQALSPETRHDAVGLELDAIAPPNARLALGRQSWRLQRLDRPDAGGGNLYLLEGPTHERLPVKTLLEGLREDRSPVLRCEGYELVRIELTQALAGPIRYSLTFGQADKAEPSAASPDPDDIWDYGPVEPLILGAASPHDNATPLIVRTMPSASEPWSRPRHVRGLTLGGTPAPADLGARPASYLLVTDEDRKPTRYGIVAVAQRVPSDQWRPAAHLVGSSGRVAVSWRGFVDWATVVDIRMGNQTRGAVLFERGFALDGDAWIAAPFAGIAMLKNGSWWANAAAPTRSVLWRDSTGWWVRGRRVSVRLDRLDADVYFPSQAEDGELIALIGAEDPAHYSGPLLMLEAGGVPHLKGWLSDVEHLVTLPGGLVRVGGPPARAYNLKSGERPDTLFDVPELVRRAFEQAILDHDQPFGVCGGIQWTRQKDGSVSAELIAGAAIGVFVSAAGLHE
jgi:hypothetical protein